MLAFVGGALLGTAAPQLTVPVAPRLCVDQALSQSRLPGQATQCPEGSTLGRVSQAGQALVTAVAVCGVLAAARQRRGERRPRVILGPTGGTWHIYRYRAKAGDKFRYRFSTDWDLPEWGEVPAKKGRVIKFGILMENGKAMGEQRYKEMLEAKEAEEVAKAKPSETKCALLVDCDGTIVETERDGHRVAFNKAFKEKGYDCEWDVELYGDLLTTGGGKERMARYFTDYNPEAWKSEDPPAKDHPEIVELHALKTKLFMEIVRSGELPLREGIKDLLEEASAKGWEIAVCSTSNEESVKAVVETLLPELAAEIKIFAGDVVSAKKPDPEIYTLAAKELGIAAMKCVVVEDTEIGLKAGKAAGMDVIVTKSFYSEAEDFEEADLLVSSATEVDFEDDVVSRLPVLELS